MLPLSNFCDIIQDFIILKVKYFPVLAINLLTAGAETHVAFSKYLNALCYLITLHFACNYTLS